MSDVENAAMCCDVRCGGVMWNMVWCEICRLMLNVDVDCVMWNVVL